MLVTCDILLVRCCTSHLNSTKVETLPHTQFSLFRLCSSEVNITNTTDAVEANHIFVPTINIKNLTKLSLTYVL
jgi:hypothetical protein